MAHDLSMANEDREEFAQDFLALKCNYRIDVDGKPGICGKAIDGEAWVTNCSHIFCPDHARQWFRADDRCPICLDKEGKVRLAKMNASKASVATCATSLIGFSPPDVQAAFSASLRFWMEQKLEDFRRDQSYEQELASFQSKLVSQGRARLKEADTLQKSLSAGVDELRKQLRAAEEKRASCIEDNVKLRSKLKTVTDLYKQANACAAGLVQATGFDKSPGSCSAFQLHRTPDRGTPGRVTPGVTPDHRTSNAGMPGGHEHVRSATRSPRRATSFAGSAARGLRSVSRPR
eukprot:gnl/TRDRNA2_/TRDRNA2_194477_c0_seq1.p1 gnl/TRDRNA2_/TRDRNA2_194477_c0~~gnl/TRDRNA2_/TRDRNA2_194477_c0_seq1.p1  ORF type:complete len:290 (+),score=56.52 gnl/TRDRNA2_/TRDRNA2_194477_c0_seq1:71-940(+)